MKTSVKNKFFLIFFGACLSLFIIEATMQVGAKVILFIQHQRNISALQEMGTYKILCLGESTTAELGWQKSWPSLLEEKLNEAPDLELNFKVINEGVIGTTTTDILSNLETNINKYQPNMVITMMGINDGRFDVEPFSRAEKKKNILKHLKIYKLFSFLRLHSAHAEEYSKADPNIATSDLLNSLSKQLKSSPNNPELLAKIGWEHISLQNKEKSRYFLTRAHELDPNNYLALTGLGQINHFENPKKAETYYLRALQIEDNSEWLYLQIASLYDSLNERVKSKNTLIKASHIFPNSDLILGALASISLPEKDSPSRLFYAKANQLRKDSYNKTVKNNYIKLFEILNRKKIKLAVMQYPVRDITPLKYIFEFNRDILYIENKKVFTDKLEKEGYNKFFRDMFAGDFGHCTAAGNNLIATNAANHILNYIRYGS